MSGLAHTLIKPSFYLDGEVIVRIILDDAGEIISPHQKVTPLIDQWLDEYFSGKEPTCMLPLRPISPILEKIRQIPFGKTASYGELGFPRAVGRVCHTNPYPLVIPCHRVIKKDGSLGGYAYPLQLKRALLDFEAHHSI